MALPEALSEVVDEVLAAAPALEGTPKQVVWAADLRQRMFQQMAITAHVAGLHPDGLRLALTRLARSHPAASWWIDTRYGLDPELELAAMLEPAKDLTDVDIEEFLASWRPKTREERDADTRTATEHFRKAIAAATRAGVERARIVQLATRPVTPLGTTQRFIYRRAEWVERVLDEDAGRAEQWWREEFGEPSLHEAEQLIEGAHFKVVQAVFDAKHHIAEKEVTA